MAAPGVHPRPETRRPAVAEVPEQRVFEMLAAALPDNLVHSIHATVDVGLGYRSQESGAIDVVVVMEDTGFQVGLLSDGAVGGKVEREREQIERHVQVEDGQAEGDLIEASGQQVGAIDEPIRPHADAEADHRRVSDRDLDRQDVGERDVGHQARRPGVVDGEPQLRGGARADGIASCSRSGRARVEELRERRRNLAGADRRVGSLGGGSVLSIRRCHHDQGQDDLEDTDPAFAGDGCVAAHATHSVCFPKKTQHAFSIRERFGVS